MTMRRATARVLRTVDTESRIVRFVFSDGSVDRMDDVIDPNGWDVSEYKLNPVVLYGHDATQPPIGRTINGPWSDGSRLLGDVQFADASTYLFADTVFRLVKGGFLNAGSVGFLPTSFTRSDDPDRPYGVDYKRQTLLEFSVCAVPANSNALVQARAKGIVSRADLLRLQAEPAPGDDQASLLAEIRALRRADATRRRIRLDGPVNRNHADDPGFLAEIARKRAAAALVHEDEMTRRDRAAAIEAANAAVGWW